jgi:glutamyl-tRNA reductase
MKLILNSISYHNCSVEEREVISFTEQQRHSALKQLHAEEAISEAVILATCNRFEIYLYAKNSFNCNSFLNRLVRKTKPEAVRIFNKYKQEIEGMEVVRHLFEVAAGLDSQMIGENQVLSQVKKAYSESVDCGMSSFLFHKLFHKAFEVGKTVRTQTDINCGAVSIGLAAVETAKTKIDLSSGKALIIGAGENAGLVAKYLLKAGLENLIIANRNVKKAEELVSRLKVGQAMRLTDIAKEFSKVNLVIASTSAGETVVKCSSVADILKKRNDPLLIIDLAVPRNIEPKISQFKCVELINIDNLDERISCNKEKRRTEVPKAQKIVDEFTEKFACWHKSLSTMPMISELNRKCVEIAQREAKRHTKEFGEENSEKLERFAKSLVKKILHDPINLLKGNNNHPAQCRKSCCQKSYESQPIGR